MSDSNIASLKVGQTLKTALTAGIPNDNRQSRYIMDQVSVPNSFRREKEEIDLSPP